VNCQCEILNLAYGEGFLFCAGYDANIYVYNYNNNCSLHCVLSGHKWEIWQLLYFDKALFSASFDHTIKRWKVSGNSIECTATLHGHKGYVHAMERGESCLITGCADKSIKVWRSIDSWNNINSTNAKGTGKKIFLFSFLLFFFFSFSFFPFPFPFSFFQSGVYFPFLSLIFWASRYLLFVGVHSLFYLFKKKKKNLAPSHAVFFTAGSDFSCNFIPSSFNWSWVFLQSLL